MQKTTSPAIEKATRIFRMISKEGFINIFWEEVKSYQKNGVPITHEEVFDLINEEYFQNTGVYRYKNYTTFKSTK